MLLVNAKALILKTDLVREKPLECIIFCFYSLGLAPNKIYLSSASLFFSRVFRSPIYVTDVSSSLNVLMCSSFQAIFAGGNNDEVINKNVNK